uniref:Uncharacterized protein n=1 Tax=Pipistrellus kuhlii TaxID=59472 RepID=A0A7J7TNJ7_PIPKU|nr:hypothetical protein mPipKuh1_009318 [Pipistrellus kuhlii]
MGMAFCSVCPDMKKENADSSCQCNALPMAESPFPCLSLSPAMPGAQPSRHSSAVGSRDPVVVVTQPSGEWSHTQPIYTSLKLLGGSQRPFMKLDWLQRKGEKTQVMKEGLRTISEFAYKHNGIIANFHTL